MTLTTDKPNLAALTKTKKAAPKTAAAVLTPEKKTVSPALLALLKGHGAAIATDADIADGVMSTGLLSLDQVLGGGLAKHRINELTGDSGVGKTTLALAIVKAFQDRGELVVWADPENSFVPDLAEACGVDLSRLVYLGLTVEEKGVTRKRSGEEFCAFALEMVQSGEVGLVVMDSIGALTPKKKMEKDFGEGGQPAQRARLVGELAEAMIGDLAATDCALLAINHLTGLLQTDFVGNQRTTTKGGRTWNYLKTVSINLKAAKTEDVGGVMVASVTVEVTKCRRAPRGGTTKLLNVMGVGFNPIDDTIEIALNLGIVEIVSKSWLQFGEHKKNGRAGFGRFLSENPDVYRTLRDTVEAAL